MNKKIVSVQYLRAFAAISVLVYHAYTLNFNEDTLFNFGQYGVDIFFMISGFIMAHCMIKLPTHEEFFRKRIARIYPIYFWALVVGFIFKSVGIAGFKEIMFFDFTLFTFFDDFSHGAVSNVEMHLPVAWTLYYEMFFYTVCTIALWQFRDKYRSGINSFLLLAVFYPTIFDFVKLDYRCFFIFLAGFYFYQIRQKLELLNVLFFTLCIIKIYQTFSNGLERDLVILATISVVLFFDMVKLPEVKSLTLLGDSSYSLYLLHLPLCYFLRKLLPTDELTKDLIFSIWVVSIIIISILNYWFVEKGIMKFLLGKKLGTPKSFRQTRASITSTRV